MSSILARYFLRRYLFTSAMFMLGIFSLIFIIDATEFNRRMSWVPDFDPMIALTVSAMRVPFIIQQVVPFLALFAAMSTLFQLNRKYELVVARSAGISAWQFLIPLTAGAFLIGLFMLFVVNPIAAYGFTYATTIESEWSNQNVTAVKTPDAPWLSQSTQAEGESFIGAKSALDSGKDLRDVTVIRFNDAGDISERIDARRAVLDPGGYWKLTDARIIKRGVAPQPVDSLDIPTNLDPAQLETRLTVPDAVAFTQLPKTIELARAQGLRAGTFAMHYHWLIALPAMLVGMTLIAATVSLKFVRFGQSIMMFLGGVLAGFLLYVVSVLIKAFGAAGMIHPAYAAWLPVTLAFAYGVSFLLYKEDG
jgi:lipopolysaccharide export system permease protein